MNAETELWQGLLAQAWFDGVYTRGQAIKTAIDNKLDFDAIETLFNKIAGES